jgi:hypothetical protein
MEQPDIEIMAKVKSYLELYPEKLRTAEYINIAIAVASYLETKCVHNIIIDSIDITPDSSQTIYYCEKCYKTFDNIAQKESY